MRTLWLIPAVGLRSASALAATVALACIPHAFAESATVTQAACAPSPAHAPWAPGDTVSPNASIPFLSAHRGGTNLAPQQTAEAHRSALAFGVDVTEIDIHVLADGALAAFHNATTADGRPIGTLTTADYKALNAATGAWAGTAFDPARYLLFDEVLAIAAAGGPRAGLDIEFKDLDVGSNGGPSPRLPYSAVAQAVADAGLMDTSIWQYNQSQPDLIAAVRAVDPDARFNYNILEVEPPAQLYAQATTTDFSFGSSLEKFTPERLAAIHDGCAIAVPHSYDAGAAEEANQIREGRRRGVDGFQTNQPDVAADALNRPVEAVWRRDADDKGRTCLVSAVNGYGLLGRSVSLDDGTSLVVGPGGCVAAGHRLASFAGDGAAMSASETRGHQHEHASRRP